MNNNKPLLEITNLKKVFYTEKDEVEALKDISFSVEKGEIVSLLGPSGCGKTTVLSILSGLLNESSGLVKINDANKDIGYMFQKDTLFEWRTIEENCFLPLEIRKSKNSNDFEYVRKLLKDFGLWDFKDKYPSSLSGGMRQRVALIRSLATKPDILLLDEPFSALDYQTKIRLSQDILDSLKKLNKTAIFVTHNISEAVFLSNRVIFMASNPGRILGEIKIDAPYPRDESFRTSRLCNEYCQEISGYFQELAGTKI